MGGKTSTTTTTNTPPPQVMAQYEKLLAQANPIAATPYQAYTGGVNGSGFEQNQLTGFNTIAGLNGASNDDFSAASNALTAAAVPTSASVGQYMSPYISGVVNSTMANMQEQNAQQQQGVLGNAIAQGAMGGNRVGVAQAELARQQNLANQSTIANLYNTGYGQALSAAQAQQAANQATAAGFANLGQTAMQTNLGQAAAQVGAGTQQQQYNYQQYQNERSYPFQTLGWLANISEGLGSGMGGTQTTTAPAGNTGAGILGGLLALPWASGGAVHEGGRPRRAQGGVIPSSPYSGASGIVPMNDNPMPAANDNGGASYVPQAATGTNGGGSTMPTGGAPQQQAPQSNQSLQQGFSGLGANLKKQYPNGILAGLSGDPGLPATAPIPTPNPMTGEAGLPEKIGDVAAPASGGILSALGSIFGLKNGGVARGYDDGGAVDGDPLLDSIKALLGSGSDAPKPLTDQQFGDRAGAPAPQPLPDQQFADRAGVVPPPSDIGVPLPRISSTPVVTAPISPSAYAGAGVSAPQQDASGVVAAPPLPAPKTIADLPVKTVPEYQPQTPSQFFGPDVNVASLPAGMRNNNPGNIKFVGQRVPGIIGPSQNTDQGDPQAVFDSPYSGMRAAASLALRKNQGGATTVDQLVAGQGGWTPGNHAAAANIANTMGISPTTPIDLAQPSQMKNFLRGLVTQEHGPAGRLYSDNLISSAVDGLTVPTDGNAVAYNGATTGNAATPALAAFANGDNIPQAPSAGVAPTGSTGVVAPFTNGATPDANSQGRPYTAGIIDAVRGLLHGEMPNLSPDARMALMSAGFGMMASKSPNFLTAVGEGGQQGVKTYQERQQQARENALAQSEIATRAGNLGLEGQRVDIAGQQLALQAKTTAADIAQTTANTAKTGVETAAQRFQQTITPAGIIVRDVTQPMSPPKLLTWDQLQNGQSIPGVSDQTAAPPTGRPASPAPAAAAPAAPAKEPVAQATPVQPVGPQPASAGQVFTRAAPQRIPLDPRMFSPTGTEIVKGETTDALKDARASYQASVSAETQLAEMKHDLATINNSAWTTPGTGFAARVNFAKSVNTAFQGMGMEAPIDEKAVAAGEDLNKLTTRLGFDLSSALGSREAANIVNQAIGAVPGGANSPEGARRIIAGIQAANQRKTDYYNFLQDWASRTGGSIKGADEYFNTHQPPELYALTTIVPPEAMQHLRQHPETASQFDQYYGVPGASRIVLGSQ